MKKLSILLVAALATVSCAKTYKAAEVVLNDMTDSVNYALGLVNGSSIKMMYLQNDSSDAVVDEFIGALQRGYDGTVEQLDEVASIGLNMGRAIKHSEEVGLADNEVWTLNEKIFFQGLVNGLHNDTVIMKINDAREFFQAQYQASRMADSTMVAGKTIKAKCPSKVKMVELNSLNDSLNYAFGVLNGNEIFMYMLINDSTGKKAKDFIKYVNKGLKDKAHNPQLATMGEQIGKTIKSQEEQGLIGVEGLETRFDLIRQGFVNGMKDFGDMTSEQAGEYIQNAVNNLKYGENKANGEKFLAENALKEGVIVTESGLQYEVIKMGKGKKPVAEDRVKVHYHGTLIDGTVFDSSVNRGEPIVFGLNQVIKGWTEGVQLMPVGSKFRFYIPQELGYGAQNTGSIPPYSTLIFEVELLGIEK